jgi:ribosomal protein S18 acetylase RimI-like enzyme
MDWMVRPADQTEVDKIILLWKAFMNDPLAIDEPIPTHEENEKKQSQFIGELIKEDPEQVLVAEKGGELIGYVAYQVEQKAPVEMSRKRSFIHDVFVSPSHRGKGVGRSLLQACLNHIKSAGPHQVRIAVWVRNSGAIRLYREMGFSDHLMVMKTETGVGSA